MFNKIENILMPLAVKLGQNKVLIAVRDGFFNHNAAGNRWLDLLAVCQFPDTRMVRILGRSFWQRVGIMGD